MSDIRCSFDTFKSNVCHRVKDIGDISFIIEILKSNIINEYFDKKWYAESLYLLAMIDYLSRINNVPLCTDYDNLRTFRLEKVLYPTSALLDSSITNNPNLLREYYDNSIPEFKRFNIVENEVRDVV